MLNLLDWQQVVSVSRWQGLGVRQRNDGRVVMMLVNLAVNCFGDDFMSVRLDRLRCDGRSDHFFNVGEMPSASGVPGNSSSGSLHGILGIKKQGRR